MYLLQDQESQLDSLYQSSYLVLIEMYMITSYKLTKYQKTDRQIHTHTQLDAYYHYLTSKGSYSTAVYGLVMMHIIHAITIYVWYRFNATSHSQVRVEILVSASGNARLCECFLGE